MEEKYTNQNSKRDIFIDSMKGLCVIAIILIHTTFHSGDSYTPAILKNIVLLFDVPIFFFFTGCLMSIKPDLDPFKQMLKLIWLFFILTLVGELITGHSSLDTILQPLMLNASYIKALPSVGWSYWFVPTYIVSLFYTTLISKYTNNFVGKLLLIIIPIYYIYSWFKGETIDFLMLGVNFQSGLFYVWLMLLGFYTYKSDKKLLWFFLSLFSFLTVCFMFIQIPELSLQNCKFPVKLPYFISSMIIISLMMFIKKPVNFKIIQFIDNKAIYFYLSQGIGASILFYIVPHLKFQWEITFLICFIINLFISLSLGYLFLQIDKYLSLLPNIIKTKIMHKNNIITG